MAYTALFQRHELKYLMDLSQYAALREALAPHTKPDRWPHSSVRSLYFDTPDLLLARRSAEKPTYKEKLRLRSYGPAKGDAPVFVELKKKYRGLVYKRRLQAGYDQAIGWLCGQSAAPTQSQIAREIDQFLSFYGTLAPALLVAYERDSLIGCAKEHHRNSARRTDRGPTDASSPELRITFDRFLKADTVHLSLEAAPSERELLPPTGVLMEVKCAQAMPLWLSHLLSELRLWPTSFSKYGRAWHQIISVPHARAFHALAC